MKKVSRIRDIIYMLGELSLLFRTPSDTCVEDNRLYNDVGKILGDIHFILQMYKYADEDRKLKIRRKVAQLRIVTQKCAIFLESSIREEK